MRIFLDSNAPEFFNDISESIRAFYPQADISIEQPGADFVLRLLLCPQIVGIFVISRTFMKISG